MAAFGDVQGGVVGQARAGVVVGHRALGQGHQAVQVGCGTRVLLDGVQVSGDVLHQGLEEFGFQGEDLFFAAQDFGFVLFEFFGDVALGLGEGLFAHPAFGDFVLVGVAHLQVVTKHIVVGHLERRDACGFGFAFLDLHQVVFARVYQSAQFVQLGVDAVGHDSAFAQQQGGIFAEVALDLGAHFGYGGKAVGQGSESVVACAAQVGLEGRHAGQRAAQVGQFFGVDASAGHFATEALQVAHAVDGVVQGLAQVQVAGEVFHHFQAGFDGGAVAQGHEHPVAQQTRPHGRAGVAQHVQQRAGIGVGRIHQLQVADGEGVQPHARVLLNALDAADVGDAVVLGFAQVVQGGPGGAYAQVQVLYAKALEGGGAKVVQQALAGVFGAEHPVVQAVGVKAVAKGCGEFLVGVAAVEDLIGAEALEQLAHLGQGAFAEQELAGAHIQEGNACVLFVQHHGGQEVVLAGVQDLVVEGHPGGYQLGYAALDDGLGLFGVLQLVADGYAQSGAHQLGQIGVQRVVGEPGQVDECRGAVLALGEHNAQHFGGFDRIVTKGLVEVAHAEQQDGVRVLGLDGIELLHQRRFARFLRGGFGFGCGG